VQARERLRTSLEVMVDAATVREPLIQSDGKSGAKFERLTIGGQPYVLKHLSLDDDWIMRATGDYRCRPIIVFESGFLDRLPDVFDHGVVAVTRTDRGGALLMHDLADHLVPEGDEPLTAEQHLRFVDHMAMLHAAFWGWNDDLGLAPLTTRYLEFTPQVSACEAERGSTDPVPPLIGEGWRRLPSRGPRVAAVVFELFADIDPFVAALRRTPSTFLHGDWKLGNLGSHPDGRTILLDWAMPGAGPPCEEIAWYLAINRARLPAGHDKDTVLESYRKALERHGIDTAPWWDAQLGLSMLGAMLQFGWEKALGADDEFAWWEARALDGAQYLS
jgi:Phosphotransferase enzyme family